MIILRKNDFSINLSSMEQIHRAFELFEQVYKLKTDIFRELKETVYLVKYILVEKR